MPERAVTCPWCNGRIELDRGAWSYERSQVVLHLARCDKRPPAVTNTEVNEAADRLTAGQGHF